MLIAYILTGQIDERDVVEPGSWGCVIVVQFVNLFSRDWELRDWELVERPEHVHLRRRVQCDTVLLNSDALRKRV